MRDGFRTFLEAHDLSDKRIIPFYTCGGGGLGKALKSLKSSAPKATITEPKNLTHASEATIRAWTEQLWVTK